MLKKVVFDSRLRREILNQEAELYQQQYFRTFKLLTLSGDRGVDRRRWRRWLHLHIHGFLREDQQYAADSAPADRERTGAAASEGAVEARR